MVEHAGEKKTAVQKRTTIATRMNPFDTASAVPGLEVRNQA